MTFSLGTFTVAILHFCLASTHYLCLPHYLMAAETAAETIEQRLTHLEDFKDEWNSTLRVRVLGFKKLTERAHWLASNSKEFWRLKSESESCYSKNLIRSFLSFLMSQPELLCAKNWLKCLRTQTTWSEFSRSAGPGPRKKLWI